MVDDRKELLDGYERVLRENKFLSEKLSTFKVRFWFLSVVFFLFVASFFALYFVNGGFNSFSGQKFFNLSSDFELVEVGCEAVGNARYEGLTCKECLMVSYNFLNKNSRWYENEYENSSLVIDDRVGFKRCVSGSD